MANKNRAKGDRFEYKVRDQLIDWGWHVIRTPASKSAVDLTAIRAGHVGPDVMLVQCKTNGRLDPAEWDHLYDMATDLACDAVLAHAPKRGVVEYLLLTGYKERGRRLHNQPVREIEPT